MSAQVTFGRRGGVASPGRGVEAAAVSKPPEEPSAAWAEVVGAARAAFSAPPTAAAAFETVSPAVPPRVLDDEEAMRAFIGPNWSAYRRLWERNRVTPRLRYGFGLGPAVFGAAWLVYRKRWAWGFGLIAMEASIAFFAPPIAPIASLVSRMFIGRYGKSLVIQAGAAEMARLEGRAAGAEARLRQLHEAGGVTIWLPALVLLGEGWLAVHRAHYLGAQGLDAVGLLANVRHVLP